MKKLLLLNPPFSEISTPYPGIAHLTAYLRARGCHVEQRDLGLNCFYRLFSAEGVDALARAAGDGAPLRAASASADRFLRNAGRYRALVDPVLHFLRGADQNMTAPILSRSLLPEGASFFQLAFKPGVARWYEAQTEIDRARFLATNFVLDLADVVRACDPEFALLTYGERLLRSRRSFTELDDRLRRDRRTLVEDAIALETRHLVDELQPDVVGFSCAFPGSVFGTLCAAREIRQRWPHIVTVLGGGFVNTELRQLSDVRLFDYIDFVLYDDGERPLEQLLAYLSGEGDSRGLMRAKYRRDGALISEPGTTADVPFRNLPAPDYSGLPLDRYVPLVFPNVMHRYSSGRWLKLIAAHGCYWKRCSFCDVSLDYIGRYAPDTADGVVDRMKAMHAATGWTTFHFVDEAAPPALLKGIATRISEQRLPFEWWSNIRFDPYFTTAVAGALARGGCVALSGGIEVASPRVLDLIDKGVDLNGVAQATFALSQAGIAVHAYLMYGFPTQTEQETIDSLEIVRQLFAERCLRSARWHRFTLTSHSPIHADPARFGIRITDSAPPAAGWFARYTVDYSEDSQPDLNALGRGLRAAVKAFSMEDGWDRDVREWFKTRVASPTVKPGTVRSWLEDAASRRSPARTPA